MPNTSKIGFLFILGVALLSGCSNSTTYTSTTGKGIALTFSGFYPSRTGESYALWFEIPIAASHGKQNATQHGNTVQKLVTAFRVDATGSISGLDTSDLVKKLGAPLALVLRAIISVEKTGSIDTIPHAELLSGDITGSTSTGTATLTTDGDDALNTGFSGLTGALTLAYPTGQQATDLELYLMRSTSATQTEPGISNLPALPEPWHYALWAVDSATKSLPPFNIYYGTFLSPSGADSNPGDNHFDYPGGRYPADSTQPAYGLRSGKVSVFVTLEPFTDGVRPAVPFGAILLKTTIGNSAQAFSPIELSNQSASLPSASITIYR